MRDQIQHVERAGNAEGVLQAGALAVLQSMDDASG